LAVAGTALASGEPFTTTLTGAAEVPGPGDSDGKSTIALTLNPGQAEVCFAIGVTNITGPAIAAHIHAGQWTWPLSRRMKSRKWLKTFS